MKNYPPVKSKYGIFLLYEGLPPTIIESQVLAHVRSMNDVGMNMEVWSFAVTRQAYAEGLAALPHLNNSFPSVKIRLFRGVKPALPMSERCNALVLIWWLWWLKARPSFIHARTEHATAIAGLAKRAMQYKLIWDARGDSVSEFQETSKNLRKPWRWLAPLKTRALKKRLQSSNRNCDAAIFVSDALRRLQGSELSINRTLVVPCLADDSLFFYSQELREEARKMLGYSASDIVIIYVGSTSIWQCVPETVALMTRALSLNTACKALIITPDRGAFKNAFPINIQARVCIKSGRLSEVNRYLNAADFGVLLRKNNPINWVASPVKFAEYSLTGLIVITSDAIEQVNVIGELIKSTMNADEFINVIKNQCSSSINRLTLSSESKKYLSRQYYKNDLLNFYNKIIS